MNDIIGEIKSLPHFSDIECPNCTERIRLHTLQIQANCPNCGLSFKNRGYDSIGTEIQDVIDAVLEWAGEGESFAAVMNRYREIIESKNSDAIEY